MSQGRPVTPEKRDEVISLHAEGLARNEIARRAQVAPSTVTRVCREAGLSFDRSSTEVATKARSADLAEGRTRLAARMLAEVEGMLERLDDPYLVYSFGGRENTYSEHLLESAPVEVRRNVIASAGITFDKLTRIVEKSGTGLERAVGVIDRLAAGFNAAAEQYRSETPTDEEEAAEGAEYLREIKEIES